MRMLIKEEDMFNLRQLDKAISAHAMWKIRLREAIDTGKSEWSPDKVRLDNLCDFGKWLYSLPDSEKGSGNWIQVQKLHAEFHIVAAKVLQWALEGRKTEAEAAMNTSGSEFKVASALLINTMSEWKKFFAQRLPPITETGELLIK
jgi:hypothetical protein